MLHKFLTIALVILLIGAIVACIYLVITPKYNETFTEFYLLGAGGKAKNYPKQINLGQTANVTVIIINHENSELNYSIKVLLDNQEIKEIGPIPLTDGNKWEGEITLIPQMAGDNQKFEFLLFKGTDLATPAYSLHLWINVIDESK